MCFSSYELDSDVTVGPKSERGTFEYCYLIVGTLRAYITGNRNACRRCVYILNDTKIYFERFARARKHYVMQLEVSRISERYDIL
jgi:hypothetical protein